MDELTRVRILKSTLPTYWYATKIGQVYNVAPFDTKYYITPDNDGMSSTGIFILQSDCEVLLSEKVI